jgi:potassium-dependent mechanosensitive channel
MRSARITKIDRMDPRKLASTFGRNGLGWSGRLAILIGFLILLTLTWAAHAQPSDEAVARQTLDTARRNVAAVQKAIDTATDDAELSRLRASAQAARVEGDAAAVPLAAALESVQARLGQLGALAAGLKESPEVAAQRAQLEKSRTELDAQIKLSRLLAVEVEQATAEIASRRRQQFQARLGERAASILGPNFWAEVRQDLPQDVARLAALGVEAETALRTAPGWLLAAVPLGLGLIAALRWWLGGVLMRLTSTRVPPSRLRRSLRALTLVGMAVATVALVTLTLGSLFSAQEDAAGLLPRLGAILFGTACFSAYIAGLGHALLSPGRPSWRLSTLPDSAAQGMRWFPLQLAVLIAFVVISERMASLLNTSLATTVALNCITQLAIGIALTLAIVRGERLRHEAENDPEHPDAVRRPAWVRVLIGAAWFLLAGSLICLLAGYVSFGSFVIKQVVWTMIVVATAYLLAVFADDCFKALLVRPEAALESKSGTAVAGNGTDHAPRLGDQAAVLLSGLTEIVLALLALILLLAPFGEGPSELFSRTSQIQEGLKIGEVSIAPAAVLQALTVLGLSLLGVWGLKRWLTEKYLPTTRLDAGMQSSAATLLGYLGYVLAISLSLSAVGIGLDRIAWVASALSVGIGFGLQAVVSNFVSGLILLAERPVRVGDWVSLGTVEGDIRRINMRATEIQLGDRSTVIVPNSEFITKTVRNVTHANPLGLVQLKLPMPLATPAEDVRALLLEIFLAHPDVLDAPAPNVQLDGIDNGSLVFNATGFVASPRASYGVRSALLFEALKKLAAANIELSRPPQIIAMPGGPAMPLPQSSAAPPDPARA